MLTKATITIVELLKSFNAMNYKYENIGNYVVHILILHTLENLNFLHNIKGFGDYDC